MRIGRKKKIIVIYSILVNVTRGKDVKIKLIDVQKLFDVILEFFFLWRI